MASKRIDNQEDIYKFQEALIDPKGINRRNAAKSIGKKKIIELGDELFNAYLKEKKDIRTWETQTEMLLALGKIGYLNVMSELEEILKENKEHDRVTSASALTYVRLKRKDLNDAMPVIELVKHGKLSIMNGATSALTYDDMIPSDKEIIELIKIFNSKGENELTFVGASDPRSYLISAMSKWNKNLTSDYLNQCIENPRLKIFVIEALNGKKSRYE